MKPLRVLFALCIGMSAWASGAIVAPIHAQEARTIVYDTPVEGQVTDAEPATTWTLSAPSADRVAIVVERLGGILLPELELQDANGQSLTRAQPDETAARAEIRSYELPLAGAYQIVVKGQRVGNNIQTTGAYRLTVGLLGAGEDSPALMTPAKPIDIDTSISGELTNARWKDAWTFTAPGADIISITVRRTEGTLRLAVSLLDANGSTIENRNAQEDGLTTAIRRYTLPGPGPYIISVQRERGRSGMTAGKYTLDLTLEGAGADRPDLFTPRGPLVMEGATEGELTNARWVDGWSLEAQSADYLRFVVTRTEGRLMPQLVLLGANNREIQRANDDETQARATLEVRLSGPGKYTLRVVRQGEANGFTSGKYTLSVTVLGLGEDNPAFKTPAGTASLGTPIKGNLTAARWQELWVLDVKDETPLMITVNRTSGTLIPRLRILGASRQEIAQSYAYDRLGTTTIETFNPPGPGKYMIVVAREGGLDGRTSGGYELVVTRRQQ